MVDLVLVVEFLIKKEYNTQNLNTMKNSAVYGVNFNSNARLNYILTIEIRFVARWGSGIRFIFIIWFLQS